MINSNEISIIIQGPILNSLTSKCLESVRNYLPGSQVIISTWEGESTKGLHADKIILSEDPGNIKMTLGNKIRYNNTNRMIISTIKGLRAANRKYSVRIRSDMIFVNDNILKIIGQNDYKKPKKLIKKRIVVIQSHHPYRSHALFAVADWFYAGLTEDLQKLYTLQIQDYTKFIVDDNTGLPSWEDNITAEQYIWKNFLIKLNEYKYVENFVNMKQDDLKFKELYLKSILNFLIICNPKTIGINSLKHPNKSYVSKKIKSFHLLKEVEWKFLYQKEIMNKFSLAGFLVVISHYFIFNSYKVYLNSKILRKIWMLRKKLKIN